MVAFRAARVEADFGFVEYKVVAQHREKWVSGKLCYIVHTRLPRSVKLTFTYAKLFLPPPPAKYRTHLAEQG
jgi:hypothetical protein